MMSQSYPYPFITNRNVSELFRNPYTAGVYALNTQPRVSDAVKEPTYNKPPTAGPCHSMILSYRVTAEDCENSPFRFPTPKPLWSSTPCARSQMSSIPSSMLMLSTGESAKLIFVRKNLALTKALALSLMECIFASYCLNMKFWKTQMDRRKSIRISSPPMPREDIRQSVEQI